MLHRSLTTIARCYGAGSTPLTTLSVRTPLATSLFVRHHERKTKPEPPVLSRAALEEREGMRQALKHAIEERERTNPVDPLVVQHSSFATPYFKPESSSSSSTVVVAPTTTNNNASSPAPAPAQFAIIDINGNQFKVVEDDLLMTDLLKADVGKEVVFTNVLLLGTRDTTWIGRPCVPNAQVHAIVEEHTQTQKVLVFHKKRRKNHRKLRGYRHDVTLLRIVRIVNPSLPAVAAAEPAAQ